MKFLFLRDLRRYKQQYFKRDIFASISVALITIPQSIAYSILAGLPPIAGLFSAIFGTLFLGVFGSSRYLIAGPTTAVAILLQTTILNVLQNYYPYAQGIEKEIISMNILSHIVLLVGVIQILFSVCRMDKILKFVSRSVILGYFAGVMVAIFITQLYPLLGIDISFKSSNVLYRLWHLIVNLPNLNISVLALGIFSLFSLFFMKKKYPKFPASFLILIFLGLISYFLNKLNFNIDSLGGLQDSSVKLKMLIPKFSFNIFKIVIPSATAISLLAILEAFSVSKTVSSRSNKNINYNQEIFSIGIANAFFSFLSPVMPTSISISRSIFNFSSRAKTRFSAIFCSIFTICLIFIFWGFVKHIPLVALASILIMIAPTILDYKQLRFCFSLKGGDIVVFSLTFLACLFFSLEIAFFIGIIISIISYLKRAAVPHVEEYLFDSSKRLHVVDKKSKNKIRIIGISGELFFGSVEPFLKTFIKLAKDRSVDVVILRLNNVYSMDASMSFAILSVYEYLKKKKTMFFISGITKELWKIFAKTSLVCDIGKENLFMSSEARPQESTRKAYEKAKKILSKKI